MLLDNTAVQWKKGFICLLKFITVWIKVEMRYSNGFHAFTVSVFCFVFNFILQCGSRKHFLNEGLWKFQGGGGGGS